MENTLQKLSRTWKEEQLSRRQIEQYDFIQGFCFKQTFKLLFHKRTLNLKTNYCKEKTSHLTKLLTC